MDVVKYLYCQKNLYGIIAWVSVFVTGSIDRLAIKNNVNTKHIIMYIGSLDSLVNLSTSAGKYKSI